VSNDKGATLIELLVATTVFSLVVTLGFFAFSRTLSLWERTDGELGRSDDLVFFNTWIKDFFHSAVNLVLPYRGRRIPVFIGDRDRVLFITSNPLFASSHLASFVKIERVGETYVYAEQTLFLAEEAFRQSDEPRFSEDAVLLRGIESGEFSYLIKEQGRESWVDRYDSATTRALPFAVKLTLIRKGVRSEIFANILSGGPGEDRLSGIEIW